MYKKISLYKIFSFFIFLFPALALPTSLEQEFLTLAQTSVYQPGSRDIWRTEDVTALFQTHMKDALGDNERVKDIGLRALANRIIEKKGTGWILPLLPSIITHFKEYSLERKPLTL